MYLYKNFTSHDLFSEAIRSVSAKLRKSLKNNIKYNRKVQNAVKINHTQKGNQKPHRGCVMCMEEMRRGV